MKILFMLLLCVMRSLLCEIVFIIFTFCVIISALQELIVFNSFMSDEQRLKENKIEIIEAERVLNERKEHFLEEGFEQEPDFENRKNEQAEGEIEIEEFTEQPGDDIVSQGIYQQQQDARKKEIEKILEKDLGDIYVNLPPEKQRQFRIGGEATAGKISELLNHGKVKLKKIIDLIRGWLILIPGVNRFFLEQETKIKADEILKLSKKL